MSINDWPGVSISIESSEIVEKLRTSPGFFKDIEIKTLLQIAAVYALNNQYTERQHKREKLVTHPSLLSSDGYEKDRALICMVYYTVRKPKLLDMNDKLEMVKVYESIAQQGIRMLQDDYLQTTNVKDSDFIKHLIETSESSNN